MMESYTLTELVAMKGWNKIAQDRVDLNPALLAHDATIFRNRRMTREYLVWVATAPTEEIVAWAEKIESGK